VVLIVAIFSLLAMVAGAILDFQKFEKKFNGQSAVKGPICVTLPNFIKVGPTAAEMWRFNGFQNGGRPPS